MDKVIVEKVQVVQNCQFGTMVCMGEFMLDRCSKREYCYRYQLFEARDTSEHCLPVYCMVLQDIPFKNGCQNYMEVV